jgi:hypothetical protein
MLYFFLFCATMNAVEGEVIASVEAPEQLLKSLTTLGESPLEEELPPFCDYVMEEPLELAARLEGIVRFYETGSFTEHHGGNLYAHIRYSTVDSHKMARFAGSFAAAGLRHYWDQVLAGAAPVPMPILSFLESLYNDTSEELRKSLATGIEDVLGKQPLPLNSMLSMEKTPPAPLMLDAMQHCITLGACAIGFDLLRWIDLPRTPALFYKRTGIWLFGGERLNAEQLKSMESIFGVLPLSLHGFAVAFVPEGLGFGGAETALRIPGYSLQVPLVPMEMHRDLSVLPPFLPLTGIPEFTAQLLEQTAEAITRLQLMKRPDLIQRCFQILDWEKRRPDAGLDAIIPESLAIASSDRQLMHLVYLWLINSDAWLEAALALTEMNQSAPFLALLLTADLFSEGGDHSQLVHTTPGGKLFTEQTTLRRTDWPGTGYAVTAIALRGKLWHYQDSALRVPWSF